MKILPTDILGIFILEPEPHIDKRGSFFRIFCQKELQAIMGNRNIVQVSHSITRQKGALRGMHFQYPPKSEIKLIKCIRGSVFDVALDLRHKSPTFMQWHGTELSAKNMKMMLIPEGCAHGFQVLIDDSELLYLHTEFYSPENEGGIRYNDPTVNIAWPLEVTDISEKDKNHVLLSRNFTGLKKS